MTLFVQEPALQEQGPVPLALHSVQEPVLPVRDPVLLVQGPVPALEEELGLVSVEFVVPGPVQKLGLPVQEVL